MRAMLHALCACQDRMLLHNRVIACITVDVDMLMASCGQGLTCVAVVLMLSLARAEMVSNHSSLGAYPPTGATNLSTAPTGLSRKLAAETLS